MVGTSLTGVDGQGDGGVEGVAQERSPVGVADEGTQLPLGLAD